MRTNNTNVQAMAREAADEYLNNGDLNSAVAKVASDHELNPKQIQRVIEATNHEVNHRTYKSAEDKRFALKLASLDDVLGLLGNKKDDEQTKEASADADFFTLKRSSTKVASGEPRPHRYRQMGGKEGLKEAVIHDLKMAEAALEKCARELRTEQYAMKINAEEALQKFAAEARRLMREEKVSFQEMYKAACSLYPEAARDTVRSVFETVKEAHVKTANAVEGKELEAFDGDDYEALGGKIVNGNQPLFIHLKVICKGSYGSHCCNIASDGMNTLHSGLVTAIHALKTNQDVDDYIAREVQPFANNVCKGVKYAMDYVKKHANDDTWLAKTALFGPATKTLEQASRVFQFLNQVIKSGGTAADIGKNFLSDVFAPGVIGPGYSFSTADAPQQAQPAPPQTRV